MSKATTRLERYLEDELVECESADLDRRLEELKELKEAVSTTARDDDLKILSALSDGTRYTIIRLLVEADEKLCVCELDSMIDVSTSAISHALSQLHDAELVEREKDGKWRKYRATGRATALLVALDGSR
ncbi:ArsR/SmtB family transcription factor [Natrialbaceae archaeon A-gly3]